MREKGPLQLEVVVSSLTAAGKSSVQEQKNTLSPLERLGRANSHWAILQIWFCMGLVSLALLMRSISSAA